MYKANLSKIIDKIKLEERYLSEFYSGFSGFLFKHSHKDLEKKLPRSKFSKVLEIGSGPHPQIIYIKHEFDEYNVIETSDFAINQLKKFKNIKTYKYDGSNIPFDNNYFDRIIIAHTLEHIDDFENFVFQMMNKLKLNGLLSISLPTDPGLLWRIARFFKKKLFSKKNKITSIEYDYIMANEHINSSFTIRDILRYHYHKTMKESYLPFRIKNLDINLFYNIQIIKNFE